jgi:hypothetical protein
MKFVTTWSVPPENRKAAEVRFKESAGDAPPAGIKLLGRWFAVGGGKGVHVCECDDPIAFAKWAQRWSDLLSIEIYPALDDEGAAKLLQ